MSRSESTISRCRAMRLVKALDDGTLRRNFQGYTTDAAENADRARCLLPSGATPFGFVQNASDERRMASRRGARASGNRSRQGV